MQINLVLNYSAEPEASWFNFRKSVHLICKASNHLSPSFVLIFCPFSACCPSVCHCILIAMSRIVITVTFKRRLWLVSVCNIYATLICSLLLEAFRRCSRGKDGKEKQSGMQPSVLLNHCEGQRVTAITKQVMKQWRFSAFSVRLPSTAAELFVWLMQLL